MTTSVLEAIHNLSYLRIPEASSQNSMRSPIPNVLQEVGVVSLVLPQNPERMRESDLLVQPSAKSLEKGCGLVVSDQEGAQEIR
jgi:hypothetical protein